MHYKRTPKRQHYQQHLQLERDFILFIFLFINLERVQNFKFEKKKKKRRLLASK